MLLKIFQSQKGDCLLLEGESGGLVLVDGGMSTSMNAAVAPHLGELHEQGRELDVVYVSHIDEDHISGVLALLDNAMDWRVHQHHLDKGDERPEPKVARPPEIKALWHNAFKDQVSKIAGPVEKLLVAAVPTFLATRDPVLTDLALQYAQISTSVKQALEVSHLASADLLDIPINRVPGQKTKSKLLRADGTLQPIAVGSMKFRIIGPTLTELKQLRDGWKHWIGGHKTEIKNMREAMRKRAAEIQSGDPLPGIGAEWEGMSDYKSVTVPNIASLTFLVTEGDKTLLLTGDAHHDHLIEGLERAGQLDDEGRIHLDVLKVQHHGSEHNMDDHFAEHVTADRYVFCGNGEHGNPEPVVLQRIFDARMAQDDGSAFEFWFSTTSAVQKAGSKQKKVFREVEQLVAAMAQQSNGRLANFFNDADFIELQV